MTPEEILCRIYGIVDPHDLQIELTLNPYSRSILTAMQEYADEIAVLFSEWKDKHYARFGLGDQFYKIEDEQKQIEDIEFITIEEIYHIYKFWNIK